MTEHAVEFKILRSRNLGGETDEGRAVRLGLPAELIKSTRITMVWEDSSGTVPLILKTYGHRNLASWMEAKFLRGRAEREFDRLSILYDAGVKTCEPVYVGRGIHPEHGRFEILATRMIPHAVQLKAFLVEDPNAGLEPLFKTIRSMHYAGVYHGSLTLNNLVVSCPPGEPPSFFVVDLPRGIDFPYDLKTSQPVWYDLAHFIYRVSEGVDQEKLKGVLDLYPFTADQREGFETFLAAYKPSKRLRLKLRTDFTKAARSAHRRGLSEAPAFNG